MDDLAASSSHMTLEAGVPVASGPDDTVPDDLGEKLRRAWNRISGGS